MFVLGILGVLFAVYRYFKDPQTQEEKKASLLAQQVQYTIEANERRFSEMQNNIKDSFALGQNHIHTVDTKVDALSLSVDKMGKDLVRLATIIEERIPQKKI